MAFIRIKKVKDWKYAYLVENSWKSGRTRQAVKEYLGRVHALDNVAGARFGKDIKQMEFSDAVTELVKFELVKNGFNDEGGMLRKGSIAVNFKERSFMDGKKPVVFESNEGFICSHTYATLVNFKPYEDEEDTALHLAEEILGAGISIPHEVFVKLFEKMHKPEMPVIQDTQKFINSQPTN